MIVEAFDPVNDIEPSLGAGLVAELIDAVYQWVAKDDPRRIPHAGPTAQDFMAAFGLGDNDKMIGFADAQGVLFAAVQGLNAKFEQVVQAKDTAIAAMKAESDAQKQEIADLRRAVEALMARRSTEGGLAVRR